MDDAALVERIRAGDQQAWETLVDRHSSMLWRLARSIVDDDAAASDAMQTAWLRLLQSIDRLAEPAAVQSWLMTTVRREAVALSRAASRQSAVDPHGWTLDEPTDPARDPGEQASDAERHATVLDALASLGQKCRELLTMLAHKFSYDVIAETIGMAIGSIGPTRSRCLDELRGVPAVAALAGAS